MSNHSKKDLIYSNQTQLIGKKEIIGFGSNEFYIKEIHRDISNEIIVKKHYSGKYTNSSYIHLGIYIDTKIVGVLQVGYAMNPTSGGGIIENTTSTEFLELNRMWLDDIAPRNSESMALSYLIRYIRSKYNKVRFLMSFADERCNNFGIVYQAANFQYYGEHTSKFWELDGEIYHNIIMTNKTSNSKKALNLRAKKNDATEHNLRQFRYIFWIKPKFKKFCKLKEFEYPKHYLKKD